MEMKPQVEALAATAESGATLVAQGAAVENSNAPRARYDVECRTPKQHHIAEYTALMKHVIATREHALKRAKMPLVGAAYAARINAKADALFDEAMKLTEVKWTESQLNLVTTVGKNDLLDKYFSGSSYTAAWYCGLISSVSYSTIAAGDTMASHAGWTEAGPTNAPDYSGSTRPALAFAAASAGSKATSAASSFTFSAAGTIKGMFGTSNSTKDGTTGILYNAVLFTGGDRTVASLDVVNVSVTYSA